MCFIMALGIEIVMCSEKKLEYFLYIAATFEWVLLLHQHYSPKVLNGCNADRNKLMFALSANVGWLAGNKGESNLGNGTEEEKINCEGVNNLCL